MPERQYWFRRELSRLEKVLVVCVFLVLIGLFLERASAFLARVERATMTNTLVHAQNLLRVRAALLARYGEQEILAELRDSNPLGEIEAGLGGAARRSVSLLPPLNYLGELVDPDPASIDGGQWYFDLSRRVLVYRVEHGAYFDTALPGPKRARFAVRFEFDDIDGDGRFLSGNDRLIGVGLEPVEPYRWLE